MSHHDDITHVLEDFYASFASGDCSAWEDHLAEDVVAIGTDDEEWMVGKEEVLSVLRAQVTEMSAAGIRLSSGTPVISDHGEMVVVSDRPTILLSDGSSQALRATMAGRRAGGEIMVHQMHMSAPAPNADVVKTELTLPAS